MSGNDVTRGPALRGQATAQLFDALCHGYGIDGSGAMDLGGSSNLNLLVSDGRDRYVVRVYRPWLSAARLADLQFVRRELNLGGVPCSPPIATLSGENWIRVDDRLVEVEPYVESDAKMDSWERIEDGLPLLGRIHTRMQSMAVSADGRHAPATNHIEPQDVLRGTLRGTQQIREWEASPVELKLAAQAEELARLLDRAERGHGQIPRQLVHGDYWDNNVLFRDGRVVLVADLDFMGERARVDDLALTLYYANSTFADDPVSDVRLRRLCNLVDAYDSGLQQPLSSAERAALPLALARTTLCFIAMIPSVDSPSGARRLAAEVAPDISWALAIVHDLDRWQSAIV